MFRLYKRSSMNGHHFIATYFNMCRYDVRKKLTQEFCDRYKNVHLIQASYNGVFDIESSNTTRYHVTKFGFIDIYLINMYLDELRKSGRLIKSVTVIDSDLILDELFFQKVIEEVSKHDKETVIQGFNKSYEKLGDYIYPGPKSMASGGDHTGFIICYNEFFLNKYKLDDSFVVGGYDYHLIRSIKYKNLGIVLSYVDLPVIHVCHGKKTDRMTNWSLYPNPTDKQIVDYFYSRNEKEYN